MNNCLLQSKKIKQSLNEHKQFNGGLLELIAVPSIVLTYTLALLSRIPVWILMHTVTYPVLSLVAVVADVNPIVMSV